MAAQVVIFMQLAKVNRSAVMALLKVLGLAPASAVNSLFALLEELWRGLVSAGLAFNSLI